MNITARRWALFAPDDEFNHRFVDLQFVTHSHTHTATTRSENYTDY